MKILSNKFSTISQHVKVLTVTSFNVNNKHGNNKIYDIQYTIYNILLKNDLLSYDMLIVSKTKNGKCNQNSNHLVTQNIFVATSRQ